MADKCALGEVFFKWTPDHPLASSLDGHGVKVEGVDDGVIDLANGTITGKSNTLDVPVAATVRHDAEICESALRRYRD